MNALRWWSYVALILLAFTAYAACAADGNVGDPQLMTDHPFWQGELSCSTFPRLFKTQAALYSRFTGRQADNDEDKALASWLWRNTHYFHCTLLPEPDIFNHLENEVVRDYWTGLFSYGHSMCQENHYQYTAEMEYLLGHGRARAVNVEGHTSFEVWVTGGAYGQGKWVLLDNDIATVCFDKQQKAMMNIAELTKVDRTEYLTNRTAKSNRGWLPELYPGDGAGTYQSIHVCALLCGYAGAPPVVNLRPGEMLRRFPRPGLGQGSQGPLVYWGICVDGMDGPNRHITYLNCPDNCFNATTRPAAENNSDRRARFGNAVFTYKPDFQSGSYKAGVAAEDEKSVTFEHCSPYVIAAMPKNKNCLQAGCRMGLVLNGKAHSQVCLSLDKMQNFTAPVDFSDGLDLTDLVKGHYQYWLKFMAPASSLAGKDIALTTRCMASGYVMPQLKPDGTQVKFNASGLGVSTIGPQAKAIRENLSAGALDEPSFTVKLNTPHGEKIETVCWAVRSPTGCPPKPGLAFKAEYSTDGKQWKVLREDWRLAPPVPYEAPDTWSQSFFYGANDIADDDAHEVQVRISNNLGKSYQMGQFSLIYQTGNTAKTKVTYCWDEAGQEKIAEHLYPAAARMDTSWKIETGKDPKMKWVEMTAVPALAMKSTAAAGRSLLVHDDASLRTAVRSAAPGTHIRIAPGDYRPNLRAENLHGTAEQPIVIEGDDPQHPPLFVGGNESWHLSGCCYLTLRNVAARRQEDNGINLDDGGKFDQPAHHIVLEHLQVSDIGPKGNHDAIKLSGLEDFVVRECQIEGWGGQAPDMVGCHRGLIEGCTFRGKPGCSQDCGPQIKGGSSQITVRRCLFLDAGDRGVNMGGSTGANFFRPHGTHYEAKDVTVEGCTFVGGEACVAYVGVLGAVVRYNTMYRPRAWVLRILQENTSEGIAACREGRFEHNLIIFRRRGGSELVNIGPHTRPETFRFAHNWWYREDQPAESRPALPAAENDGVYGIDPQLTAPAVHDFRPHNPLAAAFGATAWKP